VCKIKSLILGNSPFGVITLARDFRNNQKVAIKKITVTSRNVKFIISEIKLQQMLKHPNIVAYRGCYLIGASELWVFS
jgi:serine/threonine protein kinase